MARLFYYLTTAVMARQPLSSAPIFTPHTNFAAPTTLTPHTS